MPVVCVFRDTFGSYPLGNLPTTYWSTPYVNKPQVVSSALDAGPGPTDSDRMCRINWPVAEATDRTEMLINLQPGEVDWGGSDRLFGRIKYRFDSDVTTLVGMHMFRWYGPPGNDTVFYPQLPDLAICETIIDSSQPFGEQIEFGIASSFTAAFHTNEYYFKRSTPTHATWWIDGSIPDEGDADADAAGFAWTNGKTPDFFVTSNWSGSGSPPDDNNHLYIGLFELFADQPWGLGFDLATTGLMEDGSIQVAEGGGSAIALQHGGWDVGRSAY